MLDSRPPIGDLWKRVERDGRLKSVMHFGHFTSKVADVPLKKGKKILTLSA